MPIDTVVANGNASGLGTPLRNAGAPGNGTNHVETLTTTGTPTGGTFTLTYMGWETAAIAFDAAAAAVQAALEALPSVGAGDIVCSGGALPTGVVMTRAANLQKLNDGNIAMGTNSLTGGTTPTTDIAQTTPGVTADHRLAPKGAQVIDTTNGIAYINTGTALAPTWTKVGTQT